MNEVTQQRLLEFVRITFHYDETLHLLAVSATEVGRAKKSSETFWKVRVALTYREEDSMNPYFDGTDLEVAVDGMEIRLMEESLLANDPPIVEGGSNELAINWVSELASPFWISEEAEKAAKTMVKNTTFKEAPFADYNGK